MAQKSPIEWTDYTSNPIYAVNKETGKRGWFCVKVSPGCGHCYSETLNVGRLGNKLHYTEKNLENVEFVLNEKELLEIIKLNNRLAKKGETANLFLGDMTDIFLEQIPNEFLDKIVATVGICSNINFQILTKRVQRAHDYFNYLAMDNWCHFTDRVSSAMGELLCDFFGGDFQKAATTIDEIASRLNPAVGRGLPLPNLHLGTSIENQPMADERISVLLATVAAVRFLSCEPLLSGIQLRLPTKTFLRSDNSLGCSHCCLGDRCEDSSHYSRESCPYCRGKGAARIVDWVIVGGESGPGARACDIYWLRSIVQQCKAAKVPVFVKQLGSKPVINYYDEMREDVFNNDDDWTPLHWDLDDGQPPLDTLVKFPKKDRKGGDFKEFPEDLRIREMPK